MRRVLNIIISCSVILAGIIGSETGVAAADSSDSIKVGVLLPLTGEFAPWGEGVRRSIQLVAEQLPSRFTFDFEDEGNCEPQKSVAGYQRLTAGGARYFIVGCLAGTKALLPIAKRQQVLLLSVGLLDDETFGQTTQLVNLATQLSTESRYLAAHIAARGFRRPAIIHWEDPFSNEFASTLATELRSRGVEPTANEAVNPRDTDYRSPLLRIAKGNPDSICFNVGQDQQTIILRQMQALKIDLPLFSNYVFETPSALNLGTLGARVEYSFPLNSAESSSEKVQFDKDFESRFGAGNLPTPNSYFIRDGLVLLQEALKECAAPDTNCVGKFFKSTSNFDGLSGTVSFHPDGSNDRPYGIKRIENGNFVWVDKTVALAKKQITNGASGEKAAKR